MRRLRESGIVTIVLLGLTGCAGVQQRLGWSEPSFPGEEKGADRPMSRLALWRRHNAEESRPSDSDLPEPSRSPMIAGVGSSDEEEGRPGLFRRLAQVGRRWRGEDGEDSDELDLPAARYAPGTANPPAVALAAPRPSAPAAPRTPSGGTPSAVADARPAGTEPAASRAPAGTTASADPDRSPDPPALRELTVDLAGARPQVDSSAVPARNAAAPSSNSVNTQQQPTPSLPEPPAVPSPGREDVPPPTAAPGRLPGTDAPDLSPATSGRGPSLPSPTVGSQPEAGSNPGSGSWSSKAITSTPGPVWPTEAPSTFPAATFAGSGQSLVMSSPQGGYVSGGCDGGCTSSCAAPCKTHKLCPLKKRKQQVYASSVVLPSAQGVVSSCDAPAPCKAKKSCFLKTWLHHKSGCKSRGCKGCKSCSYCGEPATMISEQAPIVSPQW